MFLRSSLLLAISFILFIIPLGAVVKEAPTFEALKEELACLKSGDLAIFDVDLTLIAPKDAVLRFDHHPVLLNLLREFAKTVTPDERAQKESLVYQQMEFELIDPGVPALLKDLQNRGVKILALTAAKTGSFGVVHSMEEWRYRHLLDFGIDFSASFDIPSFTFSNTAGAPSYYKGILFSNETPKGEVLTDFLHRAHLHPLHIAFVDDKFKQIQSVECSLEKEGIPSLSIHFTQEENLPSEVDENVARYQFKHLLETGIWLNDEQVKEFLKIRSS